MSKISYIFLFVITSILVGCNTYKRSYGQTFQDASTCKNKTVYRLDLSNKNLSTVASKLTNCTFVRMLDISGNTKVDLDDLFSKIPNPEELEVLILDNLELESIPQSIQRFSSLKQLSLNGNPNANFDQIFKVIQELPITFLNLQDNNLTLLPETLKELKGVKSINLTHNSLSASNNYAVLTALPELESLWLTSNNLQSLPPEIGSLERLRNLYIEHNELTLLPDELAQLSNVWVVHAGHNFFQELPIVFTRMESLLLLHINNNPITHISEDYAREKYSLMGIILDNHSLSYADVERWGKEFKGFFQASF